MSIDKHRLFIGIPLDEPTRDILKTWSLELQKQFKEKQVSWVAPENYHITLTFLGSVATEKIEEIKICIAELMKNFVAFNLEINGIVFFPNPKRPKIIAAKIYLLEALGKLYAEFHQKFTELGFALDERPYLPHITLGRIKDLDMVFPNLKFGTIKQDVLVDRIVLYESMQTEHGSVYQSF